MSLFTIVGPPESNTLLNIGAADMLNIVTGLDLAHAAAGGVPTEFDRLRRRIVDEFEADLANNTGGTRP